MDETDAGIELRVACQALFEARHSDQDHANFSRIENGAHLFEASHAEAVRLINQNQRSWVTKLHTPDVVLFRNLPACWMKL